MKRKDTKGDICMRCNIYQDTCTGEKFVWCESLRGTRKQDCQNRVFTPENIPSHIQVEAFVSLNRRKIAGGMDHLTAFAEAIVQTSDTVFAVMAVKNADKLRRYNDNRAGKWAHQKGK